MYYRALCVLLEHQLVPAYFDVKMRARYAKCIHVGRSYVHVCVCECVCVFVCACESMCTQRLLVDELLLTCWGVCLCLAVVVCVCVCVCVCLCVCPLDVVKYVVEDGE